MSEESKRLCRWVKERDGKRRRTRRRGVEYELEEERARVREREKVRGKEVVPSIAPSAQ